MTKTFSFYTKQAPGKPEHPLANENRLITNSTCHAAN